MRGEKTEKYLNQNNLQACYARQIITLEYGGTQLTRKGGMFLPEEYPQEESPEVM